MTFQKVEQNGRPASKRVVSIVPRPSDDTPLLLPAGNSHGAHFGSHHGLSSVKKTFCNIVISIVGAGVLGMPYTFKQSGWLCGSLALAFIGCASYHNMMLLVKSKRKLESEGNDNVQSYSDLGFVAYGKFGRVIVDLAIILSQGGFCVAYLVFIGENLASVFTGVDDHHLQPNFVRSDQGTLSYGSKGTIGINWQAKSIYVWLLFPFQAWLASIRSLTRLAPFSMFADVANVAAMCVVMSYDIIELKQEGVGKVDAFTGWATLPFVMGVAIYAYEGFGLVIPIESQMKDRSKFGSTLAAAMGFITTLFVVFAAIGYFAFGEATLDIITLNLGQTWQTTVVKLALCFGLFFTFPVMMCPVHEVVERRLKDGRPSVLLRTLTVLVIAWTAVGVPHFGDFLSLLGSSVCSILSFVLPALFHLQTYSGDLRWWEKLVDYTFILFGACFGIWGTWSALQNWS